MGWFPHIKNCRYWANENLNFQLIKNSKKLKKVNVWCGIAYHKIIVLTFWKKILIMNENGARVTVGTPIS